MITVHFDLVDFFRVRQLLREDYGRSIETRALCVRQGLADAAEQMEAVLVHKAEALLALEDGRKRFVG